MIKKYDLSKVKFSVGGKEINFPWLDDDSDEEVEVESEWWVNERLVEKLMVGRSTSRSPSRVSQNTETRVQVPADHPKAGGGDD